MNLYFINPYCVEKCLKSPGVNDFFVT